MKSNLRREPERTRSFGTLLISGAVLAVLAAGALSCNALLKPSRVSRFIAVRTWHEQLLSTAVIRQVDSSDCGAAAIANILVLRGHPVPLENIERVLPVNALGATVDDMRRTLLKYGVATRYRSPKAGAAALQKPFIALRNHHFVVVIAADSHHLRAIDPWVGLVRIETRYFNDGWLGAIVPTEES